MSDSRYRHYVDRHGKRRAERRTPVCDFCLAGEIEWTYPAGEMELPYHHVVTRSDDDWAACEDCHQLLQAHDIDGLVGRNLTLGAVAELGRPLTAIERALAVGGVRETVLRFMDARTAPPYRDTPTERTRRHDDHPRRGR